MLRRSQRPSNTSNLTVVVRRTWLTLTNSMLDYVYVPPAQPMDIEEWPTLADMIISNKRLVVMLAYDANQQSVRCCRVRPCKISLSRGTRHDTR